jgi:aminomethyltransferase
MWGRHEVISQAWEHMLEHPETYVPCGWDLLNTYRLDCQDIMFTLYPIDIHSDTSLWEIGCDWMIHNKASDYIGKEALLSRKLQKRFELKKIAAEFRGGSAANIGSVLHKENGEFAGYVTSSAYSIKTGRALAFAHLAIGCKDSETLILESTQEKWTVAR